MGIKFKTTKRHCEGRFIDPWQSVFEIASSFTLLAMTGFFYLLFFASPIYASHCADPATRDSIREYCEPLLNQSIFRDLPCGTCQEESCSPHTPTGIQCGNLGGVCVVDDFLTAAEGTTRMRCQIASAAPAAVGPDAAGLPQIENLVKRIIRLSTGLAFVALFVVLLWSGIKFLTSGGDPKALQSAQQTVVWALLGILFLAIAWLVLQLVANFTGIPALRIFNIKELCQAIPQPSNWCPYP